MRTLPGPDMTSSPRRLGEAVLVGHRHGDIGRSRASPEEPEVVCRPSEMTLTVTAGPQPYYATVRHLWLRPRLVLTLHFIA